MSSTKQPTGTQLVARASGSVTENINDALNYLREEDAWVWIIGDDHVWHPDTLVKMLDISDETPEADILLPLCLKRNPPWHLVLFHKGDIRDEDGVQAWIPYDWSEIPQTGVFEVDGAGSAGMLIRRYVLDEMGYPWFESTNGVVLNEDVHFCLKARELGFKIFATADVALGHLGIFNVIPMYREGRWGAMTEFASTEEQFKHIFMPGPEGPMKAVVNARK